MATFPVSCCSPWIARSWCDCTSHLELNHFHVGWIDLPQKHHHLSGHPGGQRLEGLGMVGIRKKIVDHVILVKAGIKRGEPTGFWTLRHYGTFWCRFFWCFFLFGLVEHGNSVISDRDVTLGSNEAQWSKTVQRGATEALPLRAVTCDEKWTNDMDKLEFSWYKSDF